MMWRLLVAAVALLVTWLGLPVSQATAAATPSHTLAHTSYDNVLTAAISTYTASERGPAESHNNTTAHDADDRRSLGASVRPIAAATGATYDYNDLALFAQTGPRSRGAEEQVGRFEPGSIGAAPSRVAANAGRVAGPARSTDLVLDSFRRLGKGRNAHVRTVGSVDELQDTFNAWSVGAERLAARGPKVPDVYRLPDGGIIQWRTRSATGGPSIDIFPVSGRQRTVHLADGVPW